MVKTSLSQELFKNIKGGVAEKQTKRHHLEAMHHGNEAIKPRSLTRIACALKNCLAVFLVSRG